MAREPWEARLDRAQHHLATLRREVADYLGSGAVDVEARTLAGPHRVELRFRQDAPPPEWWGAAIGDYLHNLRSSLDNLTWAIVQRHKTAGLTDDQERAVQFPIRSRAAGWSREAARRFPTATDVDVLAALREVQPFAFTEGIPGISENLNDSHPLARLRDMSNADKHRTIRTVVAAPGVVSLGAPDDRPKFVSGDPWPWRDGAHIGSWMLPDDYSAAAVSPGHRLVVAFADEAAPFDAANFTDNLATLLGGVSEAVRRLAGYA